MATVTLTHDCDIERRDDPDALGGDFMDSYMSDEFLTTNYGIYIDMISGQGGGVKGFPLALVAIVLFDLPKFIPPNAIILSAVWWFNCRRNVTTPGMEWWIKRAGRTDWVEDEVTWQVYKTGFGWAVGGGDPQGTPAPISFGLLADPIWYNKDVTTMVTDAWDNRGGICTFLLYRDDDIMSTIGTVNVVAKDNRQYGVGLPHHLRITYTLDGKTFQVMVR